MTTAATPRVKTEFLVSQDTSSKELFDQLNELTAGKGPNADLPIRAYDKGSKGITLKIYNKKSSAGGIIKAKMNPEKVTARILVITTVEKILKSESKKSSGEEKNTIDQVLGNIKTKKSHCLNHDIKIPDLITDLSKLKPIWDKSSASIKPATALSPSSTLPPEKITPPKEPKPEKNTQTKATKKTKSQTKADIIPTEIKNKLPAAASEKPNLKIRHDDFDLSSAITFLSKIKKYGEKFDVEFNSKAHLRVGEINDSDQLSFYISTKDNRKAKKTDRAREDRKAENKNTTTHRAVTVLRALIYSLVDQHKLSEAEVHTIFSTIEKKGYISVNDVPMLLDLLETGRRASYELPSLAPTYLNATPNASSLPKISTLLVENANTEEHNATITPTTSTRSAVIQASQDKQSNFLPDAAPTKKTQTSTTTAPTFFQKVANLITQVTHFFTAVRRFFGM